ncbi:MAG: PA0069 family radical SAM protein [Rhodocyclaceae bacterium]|nr:PA0069 family radical SAM protein [Rhodocyclaceae bacterium]
MNNASNKFRGRAAVTNPDNRFADWHREAADDGWWPEAEDELAPMATELIIDTAKTVISYNDSPDIPYDRSINPYRGCEHGCAYCFARPSHAYLGLSPGVDFETRLSYKPDAAALLRKELAKPKYSCAPIALGINTDAWQPIERRLGVTRSILEVLAECQHPVSVITKSALVLRDLDLLVPMAEKNLLHVAISITTLDAQIARTMEPRAASPQRRLAVMRELTAAGISVTVLVAPLIPALTDHELEKIMEAAAQAGATSAEYITLRLPHEVKPLFHDWLQRNQPGRTEHVYSLLRQMHGGKEYDSRFGQRQRGSGPLAEVIAQLYRIAAKRLGLDKSLPRLDCSKICCAERGFAS